MSYTNRSITNLKDQINIVDVVGRSIPLKKAGASYKANCPFHSEKTPSFNVNEQRQMFYCFGCQASGDVIEFVKRYYNLEFNDAVERLANEYGIQLEETKGKREDLEKYYSINKDAALYFYKNLTEKANKGYAYMKNRDIKPKYLKQFGIGYAEEGWSGLYDYLKSKGYDEKDMLELGLISRSTKDKNKYYDKFRGRVIFPIINARGKVVGFGGRAINKDDNPKYLNSQESKAFQKKNNLYGFNKARNSASNLGYLILVEGYMDVISLYQAGIENVAASLGTALTEQQARMIKRYKKIILCYDSDTAGRNAALRGMEVLRAEGIDVRVMHVTDGKDPDEFIKLHGKEAFLELADKAYHYGDYKIMNSVSDLNMNDHHDRIIAIKRIGGILRTLSPGEREEYASKAATEYDISKAVLLEEASEDKTEKDSGYLKNLENNKRQIDHKGESKKESAEEELTKLECEVLRLVLRNEEYISRVDENIELLETSLGKRLFGIIKESFTEDGTPDIGIILDQCDEEERKSVYMILANNNLTDDDERVFVNLVKKSKIDRLQREVERINSILRYAGESEADSEEMNSLMRRSMELQKEIVKEKAEGN